MNRLILFCAIVFLVCACATSDIMPININDSAPDSEQIPALEQYQTSPLFPTDTSTSEICTIDPGSQTAYRITKDTAEEDHPLEISAGQTYLSEVRPSEILLVNFGLSGDCDITEGFAFDANFDGSISADEYFSKIDLSVTNYEGLPVGNQFALLNESTGQWQTALSFANGSLGSYYELALPGQDLFLGVNVGNVLVPTLATLNSDMPGIGMISDRGYTDDGIFINYVSTNIPFPGHDSNWLATVIWDDTAYASESCAIQDFPGNDIADDNMLMHCEWDYTGLPSKFPFINNWFDTTLQYFLPGRADSSGRPIGQQVTDADNAELATIFRSSNTGSGDDSTGGDDDDPETCPPGYVGTPPNCVWQGNP